MLTMLAASDPLEHVVPHNLFQVGPIWVTNHMLMIAVSAALVAIVVPWAVRRSLANPTPKGFGNFVEAICVYFRNEMAKPLLHGHTDRYICLIWTTFFFVLACNVLGLIPFASLIHVLTAAVGHPLKDIGGTATSSIWVTGALAGLMFVVIHVSGMIARARDLRSHGWSWAAAMVVGPFYYFHKLVPHIDGVVGVVLYLPLMALEMVSAVVKGVALAIRLFANMVAGHTLLAVLISFTAIGKSLVSATAISVPSVAMALGSSCMEVMVAFLQAYIFVFLATVFLGMAVEQEH